MSLAEGEPVAGPGEAICRLDDLPEREGKPFLVRNPAGRSVDIVLVRRGDEVFGYVNACPHTGMMLDGGSNEFMTLDQTHILCLIHGAEFQLHDGLCISGPCFGDSLWRVPVTVEDGQVILQPPGS